MTGTGQSARVDWEDAFRLPTQLSEEERMPGDTARNFSPRALSPRVTAAHCDELADLAIVAKMGATEACWHVAPSHGLERKQFGILSRAQTDLQALL